MEKETDHPEDGGNESKERTLDASEEMVRKTAAADTLSVHRGGSPRGENGWSVLGTPASD